MRTPDILACSVRGCHQPLTRRDTAWACERGHTFDVARRGYLNLLQPQDRRAVAPGDSREAVSARVRLLDRGIGRATLDAVVSVALEACRPRLVDGHVPVVADLGCGAGDVLGALAGRAAVVGVGFDLSAPAVARAALRFPALTWVVANADRRLPLLDASTDVVLSVHGRRNPAECARVLAPRGRLIVAVPGPDDLRELRTLIQGDAPLRDRADAVVIEHGPLFDLVDRRAVREHHTLDEPSALADLLSATYRGGRGRSAPTDVAESGFGLTLASDVLSFTRRD